MYFPLVQSLMYEQDGSLFYVFNLVYVNLFELVQDVLLFFWIATYVHCIIL